MLNLGRQSDTLPPSLGTVGASSRLTVDSALQSSSHYSSSSNRGAMASVSAWRDQQASMSSLGSNGGHEGSSSMSSLDDDGRGGSDNRLADDSASSDGGLGGSMKRSHGDSQGDDSRDEPRRKRLITTPHRES